ncbi:MAG: DUF1002 domain-containing protein [Lachnospiraceae bacterium]|nr:DUF1002 domain-containing protein [Lachnospiraceae bacterium]
MKKVSKVSRILIGAVTLCIAFCLALPAIFGLKAFATGVDMNEILGNTEEHNEALASDAPIIAFGADLSADQRATVLSEMGLTEADLAGYKVLTITNQMEHQYLDAYLDASVIGTKALSCVKITPAEAGHGVMVTTKNITYCTTGMYRNALLTAGVQDADILVVGPSPISGTAGLIGAIKAYETMSGETVSEETLDTAMNELIATGEIAEEISGASGQLSEEDAEKVEQLIAFVKAKVAAGELETDEDVKKAIAEGEEKFGIKLGDDEIAKIVGIMQKIRALGLDPGMLVSQAEDLYNKFGTDFVNHMTAEEIGKQVAGSAVKNFFSNIGESIKNFFSGIFGG